jgi:hypothetical protein
MASGSFSCSGQHCAFVRKLLQRIEGSFFSSISDTLKKKQKSGSCLAQFLTKRAAPVLTAEATMSACIVMSLFDCAVGVACLLNH